MIIAKIFRNSRGNISGFEIKGHAGYADAGSDIICAAVSAIAYTAIGYFSENKIGGREPRYSERDGYMKFMLPKLTTDNEAGAEEKSKAAYAVMEAAFIGLKQIEISYGSEYIKVID